VAVHWYCRYGISYRDLEQMMAERGVRVDHAAIYHWVQTSLVALILFRAYLLGIQSLMHKFWGRAWRVQSQV
jgi:hypothetical protein